MPMTSSFNDYQPITWFRRLPIYATTILLALFVAGMFATVIVQAARGPWHWFAFDTGAFWRQGEIWRLITYPFLGRPSFFYLFGLVCFYWFGTDVERYLGRTRYLKLLGLLVLTPPLVLTAWWLAGNASSFYHYGSMDITIGLFVAFATLYPNVEYWGWVTMKWLAFAGIVLSALNYLPNHDWPGLSVLLATCGAGFGFIRLLQHGGSVEFSDYFGRLFKRKRPNLRVLKHEVPVRAAVKAKPSTPLPPVHDDVIESIDPLLDKIAQHGLASLTAREREKLERARVALLKKSAD